MLMKVGEQFGFRVNTFTHILEGYGWRTKCCPYAPAASSFFRLVGLQVRSHGSYPLWRAHARAGVTAVAFNSDDAEMARRLNQDTAKAVLAMSQRKTP